MEHQNSRLDGVSSCERRLSELKHLQCQYAMSQGGLLALREADDTWNAFNREIIIEFAKVYPNCRLGGFYRTTLEPYTGQKIYNFDYDFVIPEPDEELVGLIEKRLIAGYTGVDSIMRIQNRIKSSGGVVFIWK